MNNGVEYEQIDQCCFVQTFKIYSDTTFDNIKSAAQKFWSLRGNEKYVLTDEYFNNLASYRDTIQNFFSQSQGYQPLNSDIQACVFLLYKNEEKTKLHPLQYESVEIKDDSGKKDDEDDKQIQQEDAD